MILNMFKLLAIATIQVIVVFLCPKNFIAQIYQHHFLKSSNFKVYTLIFFSFLYFLRFNLLSIVSQQQLYCLANTDLFTFSPPFVNLSTVISFLILTSTPLIMK